MDRLRIIDLNTDNFIRTKLCKYILNKKLIKITFNSIPIQKHLKIDILKILKIYRVIRSRDEVTFNNEQLWIVHNDWYIPIS